MLRVRDTTVLRKQIIATALNECGRPKYVWRSEECNPPRTVNCMLFVRWVFEFCGCETPPIDSRLMHNLLYMGDNITDADRLWDPGNLIFSLNPKQEWRITDRHRARGGVNHVGIVGTAECIIHASAKSRTVVLEPMINFLGEQENIRGVFNPFE